ncbi:MAG: DUF4256 domain-containing protein [Planctomycetes bacterium]|nr:DUF4256 domain-containing protein [Planctomycetota bacterium]
MANKKKQLSRARREALMAILQARFDANMNRHEGIAWADVAARLEADAAKLWSLEAMEQSGGEPDVVAHDGKTAAFVFFDCSAESPKGRVSLCYDREALEARKQHKPKTSAMEMATAMGIELLTEEQYHALQRLGQFDTRTSSWLKSPAGIRDLGGAIFGDRRFGRVFIYHNGAQSYYAARGFRGVLRV